MDGWIRKNGYGNQATAEVFFTQLTFVFRDPQAKQQA